ncbi:phage tail tube protein [Falsihalocynthiibacter arcticus]|uniref:phage tail tube protein n=1 Tax=Falsihalocynthiibacter arcticus TaxID=1579316 RepID=UPI003002E05A
MTETTADIGYSSTFGIEGDTPDTFVIVAEVTRIKPVGFSRGEEDATHLTSPDQYKEFIAGLKEGTPTSIDFNWTPTEADPLLAAFEAKKGKYEITAPNGVRMQFAGFFTSYEPGELTNGKMTGSATIRPTGKPVLLAAV